MTVKLSSLRANVEREQKGDWIPYPEWPGVEFNVKSFYSPEYLAARNLLFQGYAKKYGNDPVPPDVLRQGLGELYGEHILHGWRGIDVDWTRELATAELTAESGRDIVKAVEWCAQRLAKKDIEFVEGAVKNSARPSGGKSPAKAATIG
ncbi:hypothetical protein [Mesorhizobium sp. BE184]|uniref:hypothetical protein n=1 Tax=Mesorhizobium sp. BE184 TaxID=2817714 RepID=UPI0028642873|nr:hypothetical protein [Mesorhizobium sp. BE184]MDR7034492.1 hypothetical protein [Mesorhizobium sp. BE184]